MDRIATASPSTAVVDVCLLNRFEIKSKAAFRSDKVRALFAYLLVEGQQTHQRTTLAALLWSDSPEKRARSNLRLAVHNLRAVLDEIAPGEELLEATRSTVCLRFQPSLTVDVLEFERLLTEADTADHKQKQQLLQSAITLYRGDFCRGLSTNDASLFEEWRTAKQEQLHQLAVDALNQLLALCCSAEDNGTVMRYASRLNELMPLHEGAIIAQIEACSIVRDHARVRAIFENYRVQLQKEFDEEPGLSVIGAYASAMAQIEDLSMVVPAEQIAPTTNLSALATPFFGIEEEIAQISNWLRQPQHRLITLVGMGGIGKTRLALEVARRNREHFPDGVWFVSLVDLEATERCLLETQIAETIADTVGLRLEEEVAVAEQLCNWIAQRSLLLVLDNWEHILGGAEIASTLLHRAKHLAMICTSRECLQLKSETVFVLNGLSNENGADVALFIERAQRRQHDFAADSADLEAIGTLCRHVGGNPLAIELAASGVRRRSVQQIAKQLQESLAILHTHQHDIPERQQSMVVLLNDSWGRFSQELQIRIAQLSVFQGGFTEESMYWVAGDSPLVIDELVDAFWLQVGATNRYQFHPVLRQFIQQQWYNIQSIAEQRALHRTYCTYYLEWRTAPRSLAPRRRLPYVPCNQI